LHFCSDDFEELKRMVSQRILRLLVCLRTVFAGLTSTAISQQTPAAAPVTQKSIGQQAVDVVLNNYMLDPTVLVSKTGKPLPTDGSWSVGKETPDTCPKTTTPCVRVLYRVPDSEVSCEWIVLLDGGETKGVVLNANEDAARYLVEKLPPKEASKLVISGKNPIYPPIARAAHVAGSVKITIHVTSTGVVERIAIVDGPEMLRGAAADAVKQWVYKTADDWIDRGSIPNHCHDEFQYVATMSIMA
jgi:Gram-negative bacterial TonB protein C-terminal